MATTTTTAKDVLLYVPNLIGYSRVAFTIGALFLMIAAKDYWVIAIALYSASFVGDLFGKSSLPDRNPVFILKWAHLPSAF